MTVDAPAPVTRPPFWRNVRVLRVLGQVAFLLAVLFVLRELYLNMTYGFRRQGITMDFDFLKQRAGFDLPEGIAYSPNSSFWRAILAGIVNTLRVGLAGLVLASIVGLLVGVGRLSTNWLVRNVTRVYVEIFRNTPVLVQIIFWYVAVVLALEFRAERAGDGLFFLSNRGMAVAWPRLRAEAGAYGMVLLGGLVAAFAVRWWRTRVFDRTGRPHRRFLWSLGTFVAVAVVGYLAFGGPIEIDTPEQREFGYLGGLQLSGEFAAILFGLVFYTAAFIAEIIRGSILAVEKGQKEAAAALGFSGGQQLRLVVLPQALRIAIPPINSQYLNLMKNSSLAAAIAYPDLVQVASTIINQAGRPFQVIVIVMGTYLAISLTISVLMNIANRAVALRGARR